MNERIGKLAVKAGAHWDHGDWNMPSAVYFSERDLEKFAELIVEECVKVAHPKLTDVGEWAAGMRLVQQRLKQHFGVEE
jgi:hypothetical protein